MMPRHTDPLPWTALVLLGILISTGFCFLAVVVDYWLDLPR
jgi:hypothetical protein